MFRSTVILILIIGFTQFVHSNERNRKYTDAQVTEGWRLLDCGQRYKELWVDGRKQEGQKKTYSELIESLNALPSGSGCTDTKQVNKQDVRLTHQDYLVAAMSKFESLIPVKSGEQLEQAKWGLQEAFSIYSEARLVKGNDLLINGLRARFKPKEERISQIEMLGLSVDELSDGLDDALPVMLRQTQNLRKSGNGPLPFMVYNTQGPVTNNEYMQFTELLNRYGMAAVSEAKYFFYKDNVKDIDNPPYNNFPSIEDLDFNGDNIENEAGRLEASKRAKKAASNLYLQGVVLASVQDADKFQTNNGYQLKRQLNDADRLYGDIQSGFNPLKLAGDFVPYQRVENFLQIARARVTDAHNSEEAVKQANRTYEVDQTSMASELRSQTTQYLDQIEELTGLSTSDYDLKLVDERARYRADSKVLAESEYKGQIGVQYLAINDALIQADLTKRQINQYPEKIQIEEERNQKSTRLILDTGQKVSVMQFAAEMADAIMVTTGIAAGVSIKPQAITAAAENAAITMAEATQSAKLDDISSEARVKNLLLEQATLYDSLVRIGNDIERQRAIQETQWARLDRLMANYSVAREDFAEAYFSNPAYRLEASRSEQAADDDFETALEFSYYAAKALEYMWSEKFNNPVLRLDGGMPEPLAVSFDPFMRAESVFSAQFASRLNPSLDNYLDALQAWDVKMRQLRSPGKQTATARFSLRDDILGLGQYSPEIAEAKFRALVSKGRYLGENTENPNLQMEFTINIADETLFPAHPNIKIETISANMVSTASRSIRGDSNMNPPLIDLVMLDRAHVRTFFAEYPKRDDMLSYQLQGGRSIDKSPFIATVEATVDGYSSPQATPNAQLSNHSPAVSTWVLRIKNNRYNNRKLKLEYLSDIELEVQYSFGKPRDIQFYN